MNNILLKIKRVIIYFIIAVLTVLMVYSCRSVAPLTAERDSYSGDEVYGKLVTRDPDIKTYSAGRMSIKIVENNEELSLRGSVRIKKDSAIMVTVNAFAGIEAARLLLTRDSVKILDRINNRYFLGDYNDSRKFFPVQADFDVIQSIFLGSSLRIFDEFDILERSGTRYRFEKDLLTINYSGNVLPNKNLFFGDDMLRIKLDPRFLMKDLELFSTGQEIYTRLSFNSFIDSGGNYFPDDIDFHFVSHNLPLHANLKFSRIETDRELNFPFSIPTRYKPF
jgi:hypothetical protein